jgi:hypothetical protein
LSLRANHGLKLANACGVLIRIQSIVRMVVAARQPWAEISERLRRISSDSTHQQWAEIGERLRRVSSDFQSHALLCLSLRNNLNYFLY